MRLPQTGIWFCLLPMFFQIYHYKPESGLLYPLSKAWPILLMPLVIYASTRWRIRDGALYLVLTTYALAFTPILSMIYLPNDLLQAGLSTFKAWPLTFYFSAAAALMLLRPSERDVAVAAIAYGLATFGALVALWNLTPASWYQPSIYMFTWDAGRGPFIRMPMMLGELALFWMAQRFYGEWRLWQLVLIVAAIVCMIAIYKSRLPTGVTVGIIGCNVFMRLPTRVRLAIASVSALPIAAAAIVHLASVGELLGRIFDASLFIRLHSGGIVWNWLVDDPVKLLFGTGSISSVSPVTLGDFFHSADFWLTDIGWLGVLMEFGLIGTVMIVAIHVRALQQARAARNGDPFRQALADYVLFEISCSIVYSVMYAVGPVVTVAAIAWWLRLRDEAGLARDERAASVAALVRPPAHAPSRGQALGLG